MTKLVIILVAINDKKSCRIFLFTNAVFGKFVKVVNNLLTHRFCGYFGIKFPWFIEIAPRKLGAILINRGNFIPEVPLESVC